jgi:hypothetical protein
LCAAHRRVAFFPASAQSSAKEPRQMKRVSRRRITEDMPSHIDSSRSHIDAPTPPIGVGRPTTTSITRRPDSTTARTFRYSARSAARADSTIPRYLIFHTTEDLEVLCQRRSLQGRAILLLRIPGIAPGERRRLEGALNARFNSCGCAAGAAFVLLAFVLVVIWQSWHGDWSIAHWPAFAMRAIVASMLGGLIGKTVGRDVARRDLSRLVRGIRRQVTSRTGDPECQAARSG